MNEPQETKTVIPEGNVEKVERAAKYTRNSSKTPKKKGGIIALVAILAVCGVIGGLGLKEMNRDTFPSSAKINGVDVAGMTEKEAEQALTNAWNQETIKIQADGSETAEIALSDLGLEYNIGKSVDAAMHPGFLDGLKNAIQPSSRTWTIKRNPKAINEALDTEIQNLDFVKNHKTTVETKDAYLDLNSTDFAIVKEVYGDDLDTTKMKTDLLKAISNGKSEFTCSEKEYIKQPSVKSDSKKLKDEVAYAKKYWSQKIVYKTSLGQILLTPADLSQMKEVSEDGKVTINEEAVKKFVEDTLRSKVSTVGITRTRKSPNGETYTVSGGDYGLTLNTEEETKALTEDLKSDQDVTRYPKYNQSPNADGTYTDIGGTYVEVCVHLQHAWFVKNGQVVIDRDVVTGNVAKGHSTPRGVYRVKYKTTNATLTDNQTYSSDVNYWMPFNGGIGMHDATYLSQFGGTRYLTNGSHGCINMPLELAQTIYASCFVGMPVIIRN